MCDQIATCNWCEGSVTKTKCDYQPSYNMFDDKCKDLELRDHDFAVKKMNMMECQIKKLNIEQMQKNSEIRSLKNILHSYGDDYEETWQPDLLITYYQQENIKLQTVNEELKEKVRHLEETLCERDYFSEPCQGVEYIQNKMQDLREYYMKQNSELRTKNKQLSLKIVEVEANNSCKEFNRLKVKLRQLIKCDAGDSNSFEKEFENDIQILKDELEEKHKQLEEINKQLAGKDKEMVEKNKELEEKDKRLEEKGKELEEKGFENNNLKKKIQSESDKLAFKQDCLSIIVENECLKKELKEVKTSRGKIEADLVILKKTNIDLIKERDVLVFNCETAKSSNEKFEEASIGLENSTKKLEKVNNKFENCKKELERANNNLDNSKKELEGAYNNLENSKQEFEKLKTYCNKIEANLVLLKQKNADLIKENIEITCHCRTAKKSEEKLEEANNDLDNSKLEFKQVNNVLESPGESPEEKLVRVNNNNLKNTKKQKEKVQNNVEIKNKQDENCQDLQVEQYTKLNKELCTKLNDIQWQKSELEAKLQEICCKCEKLTAELNQTKSKLDENDGTKIAMRIGDSKKRQVFVEVENQESQTNLINSSLADDTDCILVNKCINTENYQEDQICQTLNMFEEENDICLSLGNVEEERCEKENQNYGTSEKLEKKHLMEELKFKSSLIMNYLKATEILKMIIVNQLEAINRVRYYFLFLKCEVSIEPTMAKTKPPEMCATFCSEIDIDEVLTMSQYMNDNIFFMEKEVQTLIYLRMEGEQKRFDLKSWVKSSTMTELAQLHDQICVVAYNKINNFDVDKSKSKKACTKCLCKKINAKQKCMIKEELQTVQKLNEIQHCLLSEQNQLSKLSESMEKVNNSLEMGVPSVCHTYNKHRVPCKIQHSRV